MTILSMPRVVHCVNLCWVHQCDNTTELCCYAVAVLGLSLLYRSGRALATSTTVSKTTADRLCMPTMAPDHSIERTDTLSVLHVKREAHWLCYMAAHCPEDRLHTAGRALHATDEHSMFRNLQKHASLTSRWQCLVRNATQLNSTQLKTCMTRVCMFCINPFPSQVSKAA
jgi:hypothetical protein